MKKRVLLLILALVVVLVGCGDKKPEESSSTAPVASSESTAASESSQASESTEAPAEGALTGEARGYGGTVKITVTKNGDDITDVKIDAPDETPTIGGAALETLAKAIVDADKAEVDVVAGATVTSEAVIKATQSALGGNAGTDSGKIAYKPGTYTGEASGRNDVVKVDVTVTEDKIESVKISDHKETTQIADVAFERIPKQIVEFQTLNIDSVTGATVSSVAVLKATEKALLQATDSVDTLYTSDAAQPKAGADETYDVDVVVVGAGGAGMSASLVAAQNGAKVLLLEKTSMVGGNSILAGGPVNAPEPDWQKGQASLPGEDKALEELANTPESEFEGEFLNDFKVLKGQIAEYLKTDRSYLFDSDELFRIQTYLGGKRKDFDGNLISGRYDLVKKLTSEGLDSVNWLKEQGIEFIEEVYMPVGALWRRGHKPVQPKGSAFAEVLPGKIEAAGGEILTETKAEKIIMKDGRAAGIEAVKADGTKVTVNASKGVIITSGGYGKNIKMLQEYNNYWKDVPDDLLSTNAAGQTGDGIVMGKEVGAALTGMGFFQMMPISDPVTGDLFTGLIAPPADLIFVNKEGKRFINEDAGRDTLSIAAFDNGGTFYMIADENIKDVVIADKLTTQERVDSEVARGVMLKADTIEELAKLIDVPADNLAATIDSYNKMVDAGEDKDFGKSMFDHKVEKAPFYATPRKPSEHHTMGGLVIDTEAHVLNEQGEIIPGLFAAGEVTGGIHAGNRLGGNALTDIVTFGRTAGLNAATGK